MTITKQSVRYDIGGKTYESLAVWDDASAGRRPMVLVAPTFMGRTAFEEAKVERLAALGYAALAVDIFGVDVKPANYDEAGAAMQAVDDDRAGLVAMMQAALDAAIGLDVTDPDKIAAIGFCFGGKCALDLARQGADLKGVVTFHGIFDQPGVPVADTIPAKILALHGWDDPLAKPEDVIAFATEMTEKKADWQLHAYGHTEHGFTNTKRPEMYREAADRRSWQAMENFLAEVFG
jgi:dienelactone hydrolase